MTNIPTCPPFFSTIDAKIAAQNGKWPGALSNLISGTMNSVFNTNSDLFIY